MRCVPGAAGDEGRQGTKGGEGRVYGGGLHKLEPKELANAPADGILELLAELHGTPRQHSFWR